MRTNSEVHKAWTAEIESRVFDITRGRVQTLSRYEVKAQLRGGPCREPASVTLDARYHPDALAEFDAAVAWYEDRGPGLGDRFKVAWMKLSMPVSNGPSPVRFGRVEQHPFG